MIERTTQETSRLVAYLSSLSCSVRFFFFFFQAEDGIRDLIVTGVQTCALPIFGPGQRLHRSIPGRAFAFEKKCHEPPGGGVLVVRFKIGRASCRERV